MVQTWP
ncbi:unnamed protein product [Discula destructiva]